MQKVLSKQVTLIGTGMLSAMLLVNRAKIFRCSDDSPSVLGTLTTPFFKRYYTHFIDICQAFFEILARRFAACALNK